LGCFLFQAVLILVLSQAQTGSPLASTPALILISAILGANYGANLAIFPSITKDYYGLKNFGVNYGLVFTAWGIGGFVLSMLAGRIHDIQQSYTYAYYVAAALLVLGAAVIMTVKPPHVARHEPTEQREEELAAAGR
jgi:MFS transporter, OFA family, oxalate/formate antiporter